MQGREHIPTMCVFTSQAFRPASPGGAATAVHEVDMISFPMKRMNRALALVACGAALLVAPCFAQTTPPPPPPDATQGPPPAAANGPRRGGPDQRAQMMQRQLNLTPDQTSQVKTLLETERSKMEALRSNTALSQDDMRTQAMATHQDTDTKVRALLTPDQVTKYDAMQARMKARMQGRQGDGGGTPPPAPGAPQQ